MNTLRDRIRDKVSPEIGPDYEVEVEALDQNQFDFSYVIRARQKKSVPSTPQSEPSLEGPSSSSLEGIYTASGDLNAAYLLENAKLLKEAGEYALARNIYSTLLKAGGMTDIALFEVGRCFELEGTFEKAKKNYEEAIAYQPSKRYYRALGDLLFREKEYEKAAKIFERAIRLKSLTARDLFDFYQRIGKSYSKNAQLRDAIHFYEKALEVEPQADSILVDIGKLHLRDKDVKRAKRAYSDALVINSKNGKAHLGLGCCHLVDGNPPAAHESFVRSLEVDPLDSAAVYYLVKTAYEIKRYEEAARLVAQYVNNAPISISLLYSLAGLQYHLGRYDQSIKTCEKILSLREGHSGAQKLLKLIDRKSNTNSSRRTDVSKSESVAGEG